MTFKQIIGLFTLCSSPFLFAAPPSITTSAQHEECLTSTRPVIILYTNPARCAPCRALEPIFNKAALTYTDIDFYVVNTNTQALQTTLKNIGIQSIPTIVFNYNKKSIMRTVGRLTEADLKNKILSFKTQLPRFNKA